MANLRRVKQGSRTGLPKQPPKGLSQVADKVGLTQAGPNNAADHITVAELALAQLPAEQAEVMEIVIRTDTAGATHKFLNHCHAQDLQFNTSFELSEPSG